MCAVYLEGERFLSVVSYASVGCLLQRYGDRLAIVQCPAPRVTALSEGGRCKSFACRTTNTLATPLRRAEQQSNHQLTVLDAIVRFCCGAGAHKYAYVRLHHTMTRSTEQVEYARCRCGA